MEEIRGENRHTHLIHPKGSLNFEEDKGTPFFPLFVVLAIHQTFAFLFVLSSVHRVSVSRFFILYWIYCLVTLLVRIDKSLWFFQLSVIESTAHQTILFKNQGYINGNDLPRQGQRQPHQHLRQWNWQTHG